MGTLGEGTCALAVAFAAAHNARLDALQRDATLEATATVIAWDLIHDRPELLAAD